MKKGFILFFVYSAIIFASLGLFLVFHKNTEVQQPKEPEAEETKPLPEQPSGSNETEETVTYATKLTLNCARTISIKNNTSVELLPGYIAVEPADKINSISILVVVESGIENGLTFSNNIISATNIGRYKIKFSVKKSATSELTDTIIVNVVENTESLITQNITSAIVGSQLEHNELFSFNSAIVNFNIETDNKINYSNGIFILNAIGESYITIRFDLNYIRRTITFKLTIKDVPNYEITLLNYSTNTVIENNEIIYSCNIGDSLLIQYEIINRREEHVNQGINIEINSNIISYQILEPLIEIKCLEKGSVILKIICEQDPMVYTTLTINFI